MNILVVAFFGVFFVIGLLSYSDYGVSADEATQRGIGEVSLSYVNRVIPLPFLDHPIAMDGPPESIFETQRDRAYGVAFELPAEYLIQAFGIKDAYAFDFRHLLNFLLFYVAVYFFYRLLCIRYQNQTIALLGAMLLVLSPRIFGDAFFNDKDLVFLSLFVIASFTLVQWLTKPNYQSLILHALACALAIDVRIMAIILPALTIVVVPIWQKEQGLSVKKIIAQLLIYVFCLILLVIAFWPWLWTNPLGHFLEAFWRMARFENVMEMRFLGKIIDGGKLPWSYVPVWLGVTTPIFYSVLFFVGVSAITYQTWKLRLQVLREPEPFQDMVFLVLFFAPLGAVIVLHSVLYNGWRQMYFIYPAFIVIATRGLYALWNICQDRRLLKPLLICLVTFCLSYTAYWMVRWHPYQYLYFNVLAGESSKRFDVDYWGVAYREPILAILNQDPTKKYAIYDAYSDGPIFDNPKRIHWGYWQLPHGINILNLPAEQRARIIGDRTEVCSDYVFTTLMGNRQQYLLNKPEFSVFHELKVDGQIVYTTFKRNVNLYEHYSPALGKVIDFGNRNTQCFLTKDWGQNEDWGVWSTGVDPQLALFMPSGNPKTLTLDLRAFIQSAHPSQLVNISINGITQKTITLNQFDNNQIELTIPPSAYGKEWINLSFNLAQAISPKELGMGEDTRKLGIGLKSAVFR
jgi:hypothetical protein